MNEKIRELAKQSGLVQYDSDSKMIDAEKFAELIIIDIAFHFGDDVDYLKEHFGIN